MKLSIVMPAFNERQTIRDIVRRVLAVERRRRRQGAGRSSTTARTDGTRDILRELDGTGRRARHLSRAEPRKGGRRRRVAFARPPATSCSSRTRTSSTTRTTTRILLRPILDGDADVVYGSRFLGSPRGHRVLYFWHSVGNKLLTFMSNAFTNLNLTDMETCYKVMRREVADRLDLRSQRFGIEPEITCKVARLRARIYEVPISYHGRTYDEGKKIGLQAMPCRRSGRSSASRDGKRPRTTWGR